MQTILQEPSFAETYERLVVPGLFQPYAHDLIERARPIGPSDRVLDLGCGTGVVARTLRDRLGGAARITGLDANPQMIEVARSLAPELDWRQGDAMALPFEDGAFDLIVSQQMLQFARDRGAAVREMRRVLAPGGRIILSTWRQRSEQPLYDALGSIAEHHLGASTDPRFAFGDGEALRTLLLEAGFSGVRVQSVSLTERLRDPYAHLAAAKSFTGASRLTDAERESRLRAVDADSKDALAVFAVDGGYAAPTSTNVAIASVGV